MSITLIWELLERSFPLQNLSMDGQRSHERVTNGTGVNELIQLEGIGH